jgi:hypothetical protein
VCIILSLCFRPYANVLDIKLGLKTLCQCFIHYVSVLDSVGVLSTKLGCWLKRYCVKRGLTLQVAVIDNKLL